MLREAAVAEAAGMKVFPSFSGSVNASKTNVERKRKIGKERDGEKDKRQDSKTKQQKTQHSTSFYAELRCCSRDKS